MKPLYAICIYLIPFTVAFLIRNGNLWYKAVACYVAMVVGFHFLDVRFINPIMSIYAIGLGYAVPLLLVTYRLGTKWQMFAIALALCLASLAHFNTYRIVERREHITALVPQWAGKRVVVISDLHSGGTYDRRWLNALKQRIESLNPDAIFLLGDAANGSLTGELQASDFRFKVPAYAVMGNHDIGDTAKVLGKKGWVVLDGYTDVFGQRIWGVGIDDTTAPIGPNDVVLTHYLSKQFVRGKLVFMGHSHGGQLWPITYFVEYMNDFREGWYTVGKSQVFSHVGTGSSVIRGRLGTNNTIVILE